MRTDEEAAKDFQRALVLSGNRNTESWKGLGYLYMLRGQKHEAIFAFRKYLSLMKANGAQVDSEVVFQIHNLESSGDLREREIPLEK